MIQIPSTVGEGGEHQCFRVGAWEGGLGTGAVDAMQACSFFVVCLQWGGASQLSVHVTLNSRRVYLLPSEKIFAGFLYLRWTCGRCNAGQHSGEAAAAWACCRCSGRLSPPPSYRARRMFAPLPALCKTPCCVSTSSRTIERQWVRVQSHLGCTAAHEAAQLAGLPFNGVQTQGSIVSVDSR